MLIELPIGTIRPESLTTGKNLPVKPIKTHIWGDPSIVPAMVTDVYVCGLVYHGNGKEIFTLAQKNGVPGSGKKTPEDLIEFMKMNGIDPINAAKMIKDINIGDRFSLVNGLIGNQYSIAGYVKRGSDDNDPKEPSEITLALTPSFY